MDMERDSELVFEYPIEDNLDLHTFRPEEVPELLEDYLQAVCDKGFREVRIIHGKGKGILRDRVHAFLKRHPRVVSFHLADRQGGDWGATIVVLNDSAKIESFP